MKQYFTNLPEFKSNLNYYLLSPFTLTVACVLILLFTIPEYFQKYTANIISSNSYIDNVRKYYDDLDGDGLSESMHMRYTEESQKASISFHNSSNFILDQWNVRGKWLIKQFLHNGDYDANNYKESYCFTYSNDSIFMHAIEFFLDGGLKINDRFICKTSVYNINKCDVLEHKSYFTDIDNDGYKEFIFTLAGGFSKYPRKVFAYYVKQDSLVSTPISGSIVASPNSFLDMNGDGVEELSGFTAAYHNIPGNLPYSDSCVWLMVINLKDHMKYLFDPIQLEKCMGSANTSSLININNTPYIASTSLVHSSKENQRSVNFRIHDSKGNLLNEIIKQVEKGEYYLFLNNADKSQDKFYLIDNHGNTYHTDLGLKLHPIYKSNELQYIDQRYYDIHDLNGDNKSEYLFINRKNLPYQLCIYNNNLDHLLTVNLKNQKQKSQIVFNYNYILNQKNPNIHIQLDDEIQIIEFHKNKYFMLQYPSYLLAIVLIYLFFWFLQKGQNRIAKRFYEKEKTLKQQQLAIAKNQLEPHFMLNTLNNIGELFMKEKKEDALFYFGKFASLIKHGLMYADQTETSLEEELSFVRNYLILQKRRFNDNLEFEIHSEKGINVSVIRIPHSLLFTFVENAVKHGLYNLEGNRKLKVEVLKKSNEVIINISDNGIGRAKSKALGSGGTGKGLMIVQNIIDGYNSLYRKSISYSIEDIIEHDEVKGTYVCIIVKS